MKKTFFVLFLMAASLVLSFSKASALTEKELIECARRDLTRITKWDDSQYAQFKMFMPSKVVSMYYEARKESLNDPFLKRVHDFETCKQLQKMTYDFTAERHHELKRKYSFPLKVTSSEVLDDFVDWSLQLKQSDIDSSAAMVRRVLIESGYTKVAQTITMEVGHHRFIRSLAIQANSLNEPFGSLVKGLKIAGSPALAEADRLDAEIFAELLRRLKIEIEADLDTCNCNWSSVQ